ncbi:MAG: hypothetical protein NW226_15255 [Microscillaceae bacterium]|nr:hypothetical protein [Microscillaceae bacterium]
MKAVCLFSKLFYVSLLCIICSFSTQAQESDNRRLNVYGFSEILLLNRFGEAPNKDGAEIFKSTFGEDAEEELEDGSKLFIRNLNLLFASELSEKLKFQGELSFEREGDEFQIDLERVYLDYRISEKFGLQAGVFLNPFGYLTQNPRNIGYLNNSLRIRNMINEEFGYAAFRILGLQLYGTFAFGEGASGFKYQLAAGRMRSQFATQDEIGIAEIGANNETDIGYTFNLEFFFNTEKSEMNFGIGGFANPKIRSLYFDSLGVVFTEDNAEEMELRELTIAPYIRLDFNKWQFLTELHWTQMTDLLGNTESSTYSYLAVSAEVLFKTKLAGRPFYPYLRYDVDNVPDVPGGGPFYSVKELGEGEFVRGISPNRAEAMVGFAWDIFPFNRFKMEYSRILDGIEPQNAINISSSFSF